MLEVLSVHAPKCGGVTLKSLLVDAYGPDRVYFDYGLLPPDLTLAPEAPDKQWVSPDRWDVIHGFVHPAKYDHVERRLAVTVLREPISRLISHYWYWKHYPAGENLFVQKLQSGELSIVGLAQIPALGRLYEPGLFDGFDMERFDIIGRFENLDADLGFIGETLGKEFPRRRTNESPEPSYRERAGEMLADARLMRELRAALSSEIKFYETWAGRGTPDGAARPPRMPRKASQPRKAADPMSYDAHYVRLCGRLGVHRSLVPATWDAAQTLQCNFLLSRGLGGDDSFLDIGCGVLRAAVPLAVHLKPGHYFGYDWRRELVDLGYENEVRACGMEKRIPRSSIRTGSGFDFSGWHRSFNAAQAAMVFHMLPPEQLERCLTELRAAMRPDGWFVFTFLELPEGHPPDQPCHWLNGEVTFPDRAPWHLTREAIFSVAARTGWRVSSIIPWGPTRFKVARLWVVPDQT